MLSDGPGRLPAYWINAYDSSKLRNALDDMRLTRHELVKLARDRYYDALTIRIFATGKDYVVRTDRSDGAIVRGSKDTDREYSEVLDADPIERRRGAPRVGCRVWQLRSCADGEHGRRMRTLRQSCHGR